VQGWVVGTQGYRRPADCGAPPASTPSCLSPWEQPCLPRLRVDRAQAAEDVCARRDEQDPIRPRQIDLFPPPPSGRSARAPSQEPSASLNRKLQYGVQDPGTFCHAPMIPYSTYDAAYVPNDHPPVVSHGNPWRDVFAAPGEGLSKGRRCVYAFRPRGSPDALISILRGCAAVAFGIVTVSKPSRRSAAIRELSTNSGSRMTRSNVPATRSAV